MSRPAEPEPFFMAMIFDRARGNFQVMMTREQREQVEAQVRDQADGRPYRIFRGGVPGFTRSIFHWMRHQGLTVEEARVAIAGLRQIFMSQEDRLRNLGEITGIDPNHLSDRHN